MKRLSRWEEVMGGLFVGAQASQTKKQRVRVLLCGLNPSLGRAWSSMVTQESRSPASSSAGGTQESERGQDKAHQRLLREMKAKLGKHGLALEGMTERS